MNINSPIDVFYEVLSISAKRHLANKVRIKYSKELVTDLSAEIIDYAASIEINGSLIGDLLIFTSNDSLKFMFKAVYETEFEVLEKEGLIQDSLNEFLNTIIANSTELFSIANFPIEFGTPHKKNKDLLLGLFKDFKSGVKIGTRNSYFILTFVNKN